VKTRRLRLIVDGFLFGVYHLNFLSHSWGSLQFAPEKLKKPAVVL